MNKSIRSELLQAFAEMGERYPDWRFGQMIANASYWAEGAHASAIWDVEDLKLLETVKNHLKKPN